MSSILKTAGAKPNVKVMRQVADKLGIELPKGSDPEKLVKALREAFEERCKGIEKSRLIECAACGETTDDDEEITLCPFCGDEGEDSTTAEAGDDSEGSDDQAAGATEDADTPPDASEVDEGAEVEEPPTVDVGSATSTQETTTTVAKAKPDKTIDADKKAALRAAEEVIERETKNMLKPGYEMGVALADVHDNKLYEAEGFANFKEYIEKRGMVSFPFAYKMVRLVKKFDKDTFLKVGQKKLLIVAMAPEEDQAELAAQAGKGGSSQKQLQDKVKEKKAAKTGKKKATPDKTGKAKEPAAKTGGEKGRPEKSAKSIVLLAKVGAAPATVPFVDKKTRKVVKEWNEGTFAEIRVSDDVSLLVGLKTDARGKERKIVGLSYTFKKAEK